MIISPKFIQNYIAYVQSYLPIDIAENEEFSNSIKNHLEGLIELSSAEVCNLRKGGMGLTIEADELAERVLKLSDGDEFIAGVRYKNLNIHFPFIEVIIAKPFSDSLQNEIVNIVQKEFKNIKPLGILFKDRPHQHPRLEKWAHTVFGNTKVAAPKEILSDIKMNFTHDISWYEIYFKEYQERLQEKSELQGFVRIADKDEFQDALKDQALLVVSDEHGFCGVFAGVKSPLYGLNCIYMVESYLSKRWIGKKIAPLAHSVFLNQMEPKFKYVWGNIYDKNISSLKTAEKIGRRIIETEYFIRFS